MATAWSDTYLTKLGQIKPDGSNIMTVQRNFELCRVLFAQLQSSLDTGIETAVQAGDIDVAVAVPLVLVVGDETTALTTGTAKLTFRMPQAMTLTAVRASVATAPTGAAITVDINESGTTILSTKLTIDATEKTSTTAATPAVISDTALADDAEITIDLDTVGSGTAGAGLRVYLIGRAT